MSLVCGKGLWGIISGDTILASYEVVGVELEVAVTHLKVGIKFYKPWTEEDHKKWSETTKMKKEKQSFVQRLGKLLDLSSEQAWTVFQHFLQYEFRGSASQLSGALSNDREETVLFHQVLSFYLSDQIHLMNCRRFLIENPTHPYQQLLKEFVNTMLDPDRSWGTDLVAQLSSISGDALSNVQLSDSPLLPPNYEQMWIAHRLAAIKHQLSTLLVYYGSPSRKCSPQSAYSLFQCAQSGGLGWALLGKFDRIDRQQFASQLDDINALHCMLLVLIISPEESIEEHPLCDENWLEKLDLLMKSFGSKPWQLPPLLAWIIIQGRNACKKKGEDSQEAKTYINIAKRTIKPALFEYLTSILTSPILQNKMDYIMYKISTFVAYSLLCLAGTCFDLDSMGLVEHVQSLGNACVSIDGTANLFWNEPSGLAAVLVPSIMEVFPHNPHYLLKLCSTLARTEKESCKKAIEILKEVSTLTWPMVDSHKLSISSTQVVAIDNYSLIPGLSIPYGTHGTIIASQSKEPLICWRYPLSGWQFLLVVFKNIEHQMTSGTPIDEWLIETVVSGLTLMRSIIACDSKHASSLVHLAMSSKNMLMCAARMSKPQYKLIAALLEFFAESSKHMPTTIWTDLDGTPLLPTLPYSYLKRDDIASGYKAGSIRFLVCGLEAKSGSYPILRSLITLLDSAVMNHCNHHHVNGCIVFIMKEVLPMMLQWNYASVTDKVECMLQIFQFITGSLGDTSLDREVPLFIASELIGSTSGGGRILRAVLEGGSSLGAILDSPSEWPQSHHTKQFSLMSRAALSLTHRLVGQYLNWDQNESKGTDIFGGSSLKRTAMGNASKGPPHIALTIARYVYLRLNPKLSYLALRTLTHIAKELRVPLVACLGVEAEGIRDCLLNRLSSATEDLMVKIGVLRLLTASCQHQPGIIRLFLTPPKSLLQTIVSLFKIHQKGSCDTSKDVVESLVECVAALWKENFSLATAYLRDNKEFWQALSNCLCDNKPNEIADVIVTNILSIFSLEYFESGEKVCEGLDELMKTFFDSQKDYYNSWCRYMFVSSIEELNIMDTKNNVESLQNLLKSARDFFVLISKRNKTLLSTEQKVFLSKKCLQGLLITLEAGGSEMITIQVLLAEIHLTLLQESSKEIIGDEEYRENLSQIFSQLRSNVMQTSAKCQILILSATVRAMITCPTEKVAEDLSSNIVDSILLMAEQHCTITTAGQTTSLTAPGVLALNCSLLHLCFINITESQVNCLMQQSHLRHSLMNAASIYTKEGNSSVVKEILRLFALFARLFPTCQVVTSSNLASSISLALLSQPEEVTLDVLPDLLWCTIYCAEKKGISELNDVISIAALHGSLINKCVQNPHLYPKMALAATSLCRILIPHQSLWRVYHQQCFQDLVNCTACCVQRVTTLLRLRESLEREVFGNKESTESKSTSMDNLINDLLKILSTCLQTLLCMSPDLVELLCYPGIDLSMWCDTLIQPTCRRISSDLPNTLPNLATLADILYLYNVVLPKDSKNSPKKLTTHASSNIDIVSLNMCAEIALILLLSHSTLLLVSPDVHLRDAREVKTFLADETDSFFSHILGKKSTSSSPSITAGVSVPNMAFLKLCSQLVTSVCQTKIS